MGGIERLHHERTGLGAFGAHPFGRRLHERRLVTQRLQEPQDTVAVLRRAQQHRANQTLAQIGRQIVEDLVARWRHVFEELLHQLVVIVGKLLQHREARLLLALGQRLGNVDHLGRRVLAINMCTFQGKIDEARDDILLPDRHLAQNERHARSGLQHRQDIAHARFRLVDLVEKQEVRNAAIF